MNKKMYIWWHRISKEPFVHFIVLGSLLYLLYSNFSKPGPDTIVVTTQKAENLIGEGEKKLGRTLTTAEQKQILEEYIETEMLLREAYKQGMDQSDPFIRKQMIDKMRFSLYDTFESPDDQTLFSYYITHKNDYATGEKISLEHICFASEQFEEIQDKDDILIELNKGLTPVFSEVDFPARQILENQSRIELIHHFGVSFTIKLEKISAGRWSGPLDSKHGVHYVRITAKQNTGYLPFDAVKLRVVNDYIQWQQASELKPKVDSIRSEYKIIVESY